MGISFKKSRSPVTEPTGAPPIDEPTMLTLLGYERRARTLRWEIFEGHVINDSSWPIVLDLFEAQLRAEKVRTTQLCSSSGLPQTTVLRYLDHLEKFSVITRERDPEDHRVTLVTLSPAGTLWMKQYYAKLITIEQRLATKDEGLYTLSEEPPGNTAERN